MSARARARWAALAILPASVAACNAINGSHDRFVDEADAAPQVDASEPVGDEEEVVDAAGDGGSSVIEVSKQFTTLNGATFVTTATGTSITKVTTIATHGVIVPVPQPSIPSEDFTLTATVLAPTNAEFGILTRVQPNGDAVVYGSKFVAENKPFLGTMGPPDWSPGADARGVAYVYSPGARYKFKLQAIGNQVSAKMWDATQAEPVNFHALLVTPFTTGKGVGFYTYQVNGAVIESMRITVP